jgi:fructose-1,6-bisphosphatase
MKAVLSSNPEVAVLASEEDDNAMLCSSSSSSSSSSTAAAGGYVVVFDPLDGSRNIDAAIPTGGQQHLILVMSILNESATGRATTANQLCGMHLHGTARWHCTCSLAFGYTLSGSKLY